MRVRLETLDDVEVSNDVREAVSRKVNERVTSSVFAGVQDLRLRLRRTKGALFCVAVVGFSGGSLVTSTATSKTDSPLDAVVGALDGLPERIDRIQRTSTRNVDAPSVDRHAAYREQLKKLLDRRA